MSQIPNKKNIVNAPINAGGNVHIGDYFVTYNNYFAAQKVKIPHRLTNNIPTNADHILGRATELAQAHDHLAQHQATVLFNGIGGIGKTALASKYMAIYGSEYKHLAWITVQSTLAEAFTNNAPLLTSLQITQQVQDYIAAKQLDKAFAFLFHQLNLLERTLVVIDNANDLDDLDKYEHLFDTAACHFLLTTRTYPTDWVTVPIDVLPEDEALFLFKKLHPSVKANDDQIKSLLSKLYYHTLLIELVAKALESSTYLFDEMEEMIEKQFIHNETLNELDVSTGKHGRVVKENVKKSKIEDYIWLIFSQVKGLEDKSKNILKSIALFPLALLMERSQLKEHLIFFDVKNPMPTLTMLVERGWIDKAKGLEDNTYYKMHPLVADVVVVVEHLDVDAHYADNYIKYIANLMLHNTIDSNNNLLEKKLYNPFAERLVSLFYAQNTERVAELLYQLNWYNQQLGYYDKALRYSERSLQIAESLSDINAHIVARGQNTLAVVYRELERYAEAAVLLEKALILGEKQFGKEHPSVSSHRKPRKMPRRRWHKPQNNVLTFNTRCHEIIYNFALGVVTLHPYLAIYNVEMEDSAEYIMIAPPAC